MATLGPNDLKQIALPTYIDAAYLERLRLNTGTTYDQLITDITTGLAMANAALLSDPLIASLLSTTTEASTEYAVGVSNGMQAHTEYSRPDAKRGNTTGHMIPIDKYDRALGWTWDFLNEARQAQLDADISSAMADVRDKFQQLALTRLFKSTYTAVGSGRSMPLADGGTADATYVPIAVPDRGGTFLYTHDHIHHYDGIVQAGLEEAAAHLYEHGYDAPYDLLFSYADLADWVDTSDVTGYVPKASPSVRYGLTADLADLGPEYVGAIDTAYGLVRMRACGRIPTTMWALYKSYGSLDQRNPLVLRYNPKFGSGAVMLPPESFRSYPLEGAMLYSEWGFAIANRIGAVARKNDAAAYADPTIT